MKRVIRFLLPVLVIGAGVGAAATLIQMRPQATRQAGEAADKATRVEFITAHAQRSAVRIQASGTVAPARQVLLSSQVSGKVTWVAPQVVEGGLLKKNQKLIHIDDRDYKLAAVREQSRVEQLGLELQLEESRGQIAKQEWELLGNGKAASDSALALRKPQLENAKRQLEAAKLAVQQANLQLERTRLFSPFQAMVISENVEVGQVVAPGAQIATLIGTKSFWVKVSVPVAKLQWIRFRDANQSGSSAQVIQSTGGAREIRRSGEVLRIAGPLDPKTRTASLIVEVKNPLGGEGLPLLPGAFVEVDITGQAASDTFMLPRESIHEGGRVWVIDSDDRLQPKNIEVAWRTADQVFVQQGLREGDRILKTAIATPIAGMLVTAQPTVSPSGNPQSDRAGAAAVPKLESR